MQTATETVTYLPYDSLAVAAVVLLALCAAIVVVDKAIKAVRSWRQPQMTAEQELVQRQAECDRHFREDLRRIKTLEENQRKQQEIDKVMLQALRAILSHEINGNSIDRMKEANDAIDDMLINR